MFLWLIPLKQILLKMFKLNLYLLTYNLNLHFQVSSLRMYFKSCLLHLFYTHTILVRFRILLFVLKYACFVNIEFGEYWRDSTKLKFYYHYIRKYLCYTSKNISSIKKVFGSKPIPKVLFGLEATILLCKTNLFFMHNLKYRKSSKCTPHK